MRTKNGHHPEHITCPAHKGIPKERIRGYHYYPNATYANGQWNEGYGQTTRKTLKKIHTRRSRRYLKDQLRRGYD